MLLLLLLLLEMLDEYLQLLDLLRVRAECGHEAANR